MVRESPTDKHHQPPEQNAGGRSSHLSIFIL